MAFIISDMLSCMTHNSSIKKSYILSWFIYVDRYVNPLPWFYSSPKSLDVLYLLLPDYFTKLSDINSKTSNIITEKWFLILVSHYSHQKMF